MSTYTERLTEAEVRAQLENFHNDLWRKYLKGKYPDRSFADDEIQEIREVMEPGLMFFAKKVLKEREDTKQ